MCMMASIFIDFIFSGQLRKLVDIYCYIFDVFFSDLLFILETAQKTLLMLITHNILTTVH